MKVRDCMIKNVITTKDKTTIIDAIKLLFEKHVGALVILNDEKKIKGIFTERDALRSVAKENPLNTQISEVMSTNVITIREEASFSEARTLMTSHKIRHLPVVDNLGCCVGILTFRRILDEIVGMPTVKS